jgi:subtilisin family serine protease
MIVHVGDEPVDLTVLAAGVRGGGTPPGPPLDAPWIHVAELSLAEQRDLEAFQATGWRFAAVLDLDWAEIRSRGVGPDLSLGLLARQAGGGLVVLRDRLVVAIDHDRDPATVLAKFVRSWPVGEDGTTFEVEMVPRPGSLRDGIQLELARLGDLGGVAAEPSLLHRLEPPGTMDIDDSDAWQWASLRLADAWIKAGRRGAGVRAAIIDRGFFMPNDPLWATAWVAQLDEDGFWIGGAVSPDIHGAFCAGLLGELADGRFGSGVLPDSKLILVAIPDTGVVTQVGLARAIALCTTGRDAKGHLRGCGADVISCSLSSPNRIWPLSRPLRFAIDDAWRHGRQGLGTLVAWTTRNVEGALSRSTVQAYAPLLVVSSCDRYGQRKNSEYGGGLDVIAPGIGVEGVVWTGGDRFVMGTGYGSSLATPLVAGVAALVQSVRPDLGWQAVTDILRASCVPADVRDGWGRLDALAAVCLALGCKP